MKRIIVDASYLDEVRVALIEGEEVLEYDHQVASESNIKGNIYLGIIERVELSLQAVFVNYGAERNGFLPFAEIHSSYVDEASKFFDAEKETEDGKGADLNEGEVEPKPQFSKGQRIIVQVVKEPRDSKGSSLTTYVSLKGRYCAFMPYSKDSYLVSRGVEYNEMCRLRVLAKSLLSKYKQAGVKIFDQAEYKTKLEIKRDLQYLIRVWEIIKQANSSDSSPICIYEEGNIVISSIRDMYDTSVEEVIISGEKEYKRAKGFISSAFPQYADKVKKLDSREDIFQKFSVSRQVESLYDDTVSLKSGGYLVISKTEALTVIDVNSGKDLSSDTIEKMALNTNLEAARQVCQQLKLRGIGGMVVIDFIDMSEEQNRDELIAVLQECADIDRESNIKVGAMNEFGLVTLSRQRTKRSIEEKIKEKCTSCNGSGSLNTLTCRVNKLFSRLEKVPKGSSVLVTTDPTLIEAVINKRRDQLKNLEEARDLSIELKLGSVEPYRGFGLSYVKTRERADNATYKLEDISNIIAKEDTSQSSNDSTIGENEDSKRMSKKKRKPRRRTNRVPFKESDEKREKKGFVKGVFSRLFSSDSKKKRT